MSEPETHTDEIQEESVSQEPGQAADTGPAPHDEPAPMDGEEESIEESISNVPDGSDALDTPDVDLASETPQDPEPETTEPEVEATGEAAAAVEVEEHPELSKDDLEKEIAGLKEKARIARERTEYWTDAKKDARAAHFQGREPAQPAGEPPSKVEPATAKPVEGDFENYNDFTEALTDWKVDVKMAEYDAEAARKETDGDYADKRANLVEKLEKGRELHDDYDELVNDPIVPITEGMIDILAETEHPAEIAYHLATNLGLCTKISRMAPQAAAVAIGNIETKITSGTPETPPSVTPVTKPKVSKTTSAPAPITPVKPSGSVASKDMDKMSNEEYRAHRQGQKK